MNSSCSSSSLESIDLDSQRQKNAKYSQLYRKKLLKVEIDEISAKKKENTTVGFVDKNEFTKTSNILDDDMNDELINDNDLISVDSESSVDEGEGEDEMSSANEGDYSSDDEELDTSQQSSSNHKLFIDAHISLNEFNLLFMALLNKLSLPETHSEALFEFIKLILPTSNHVSESYYKYKKSFKNTLVKEHKLCHICKMKFVNNKCPSESCCSNREEKKINIKKSIKVIEADIETQIRTILTNHFNTIVKYKYEMSRSDTINDICNGSSYKIENNKITLLLFTDAVTYTKSVANSMWAIFSAIVELPPLLRTSCENIIFHSIWSGDLDDFNLYFKTYNSQIDNIITFGMQFNDIDITIEIHAFTGDTPARCKALNCINFNGRYGCIMCYHPTGRHSNKKTITYPIIDTDAQKYSNIKIRSQTDYLNDLNHSIENLEICNGIKGETHLYNWIKIPNSICIDYMHLCLIGTFKKIVNDLFDSKNRKYLCYTGKYKNLAKNSF
jgi:hypothetical protein